MTTSICICSYNRTEHLISTLQSVAQTCESPYEIIVVDDCSPNKDVLLVLNRFKQQFESRGVVFKVHVQERNQGHAAAQNKAWEMASGEVLFHLESDIVVPHAGWNQRFAKMFKDHPEVGLVAPQGSGRGEWIERGPYREFAWALGGLFAIRREIFDGGLGWSTELVHQLEPEFCLMVRMAGWRLAEVPDVKMIHLGENEGNETFRRQAQIVCGVWAMLCKWNQRFMGDNWDYDSIWSMSWDDFPINVAFRRQLAAWFAAEAQKLEDKYRGLGDLKSDPHYAGAVPDEVRKIHAQLSQMRLNPETRPFQFVGHWGRFELINVVRPQSREREPELIYLMKNNFHWKYQDRLPQQLKDLAKRTNYNLTEEELQKLLADTPSSFSWTSTPIYGRCK